MSDSEEEETNFESADEGDGESDDDSNQIPGENKSGEKAKISKKNKEILIDCNVTKENDFDVKADNSLPSDIKSLDSNCGEKVTTTQKKKEVLIDCNVTKENDFEVKADNSLSSDIKSLDSKCSKNNSELDTNHSSVVKSQNSENVLKSDVLVKSMTISSNDRGYDDSITNQPSICNFDPDVNSVDDNKLQSLFDDMSSKKADTQAGGWGGWGGWGSSLLSTAASSVSTFTSQVGEGFNTVLETVESSLGAPDPEQLAKMDIKITEQNTQPIETRDHNEEFSSKETDEWDSEGWDTDGWLSWGASNAMGGLTNLSNVVEQTGKTLVTGSLDVLETIGKKTFDAIGEGDHGLKQVIKKTGEKPNLSQMLRDAKDQYDLNCEENEKLLEERKVHFGSLFDEYNGLLHLEALEMLSSQCELRVDKILEMMPKDEVRLIKPHLLTLRNVFDMGESDDDENESFADDHNFIESIKQFNADISLPLTPDKLVHVQQQTHLWLKDADEEQESGVKMSSKEIHQTAIQMLAESTAAGVQHYHKIAQLIPINPIEEPEAYIEKADALVSITKVMRNECELMATRFTKCLSHSAEQLDNPTDINPLMTSVYLEAGNSKVYLEDALKLLLPILQEKLLMSHAEI